MLSKFNFLSKTITATLILCCILSGINAQSYVEVGTGIINNDKPIYSSWNYSWTALIYPQSALGTSKTITKIGLNCTNGPKSVTNQKIYIKHTSSSIYGSAAYEDPINNSYTLVYDGNLSFVNGWNEIDITDFSYNGTDNISIHWENRWGSTYGPQFTSTTSIINNNKNSGSDVGFPTTSGYLNPYPSTLPNMRFYYTSSGPATPNTPVPADNQDKASASNALSFNLGVNTTSYDLYFGLDSLNVLNLNASVKVVNNAPITATGTYNYTLPNLLNSKTKYFWRVVAKNASLTENSPLWKFNTELIIASFPYNQGFEDSTVFYPGWYGQFTDWAYTSTGANAIWHTTSSVHTGTNAAYASPSAGTTLSSSLTTPRFNLPANYRISYWWKNTSISGNDTTFFEISTNGGNTWTILDTLAPSTSMTAYVQRFQNLNSYVGNNVKFQWRYQKGSSTSLKDAYLDDIKVEAIPSGANMTLSATALNFNELYVNGITKLKVAIGNIGTTNLVVSGITATAPFSSGYAATILPGASDTATIVFTATTAGDFTSNLTINNNGTGNNLISVSGNVLPLFPNLFETFESVTVNTIPTHWNKLRSKDPYQTINDIVVKNSSYDAYSTPNVIKFWNNTDTVSPLMLITPGLTNFANDSLKFWASKTAGNIDTVKLIIGLMDNPYDANSFTLIRTITLSDVMTQYALAFSSSNTKPYIGFKHGQFKPSQSIWLDDVSWQGSAVAIPNPAAIVAPLSNAINVIAKPILKWTSTGGAPTGYRLSLGTNNPPSNIINNVDLGNTTSYTITSSLLFNTNYFWKITPYNATGDASNCPIWNFTTMADPTIINLPWTESFESVSPTSNNPDCPLGWSVQNGGMQSSYWDVIVNNANSPNNAHTGQKAMNIMFSMLGSNNDWLYTPPVHLSAGTTYDFSFWYKAPIYIETSTNDTTFEKLAVYMGTEADSIAMIAGTNLFKNEFMRFPDYVQYTKTFTPSATANYFFGFYSYSNQLQWLTFVDDVRISLSTGIEENTKTEFKLYPNPSNGEIIIKLNDNNNENNVITITNLLGQEIHHSNTTKQFNYMNLSQFEKGIYFVEIKFANGKRGVRKLVKE